MQIVSKESMSTGYGGNCYTSLQAYPQSSLKGHGSQERCLRAARNQMSLQSSEKERRRT